MQSSPEIDKLAAALVKAAAEFPAVVKDSTNPAFHSRYASFGAIVDAVRPVLTKHGLMFIQSGGQADDAGAETLTRLIHESGQWIETVVRMPIGKSNPQGAGSALTYGKRYGLSAALGIVADDDDDGNAASKPEARAERPKATPTQGTPPAQEVFTPTNTSGTPPCPTCGGAMWDNREGKKNPKAPDFKCKDKNCDGVVWPPRPAKRVEGGGPGKPGSDFSDFPPALEEGDDLPW